MSTDKKLLGFLGEEAAAKFLVEKGMKILERNFRCRFGEIDIIARENKELVFIEVKTRQTFTYGSPAEAVNYRKQQKIIQTAKYYVYRNKTDINARFDVIEVIGKMKDSKLFINTINHFENAITET